MLLLLFTVATMFKIFFLCCHTVLLHRTIRSVCGPSRLSYSPQGFHNGISTFFYLFWYMVASPGARSGHIFLRLNIAFVE
jgi:hypothetical protein